MIWKLFWISYIIYIMITFTRIMFSNFVHPYRRHCNVMYIVEQPINHRWSTVTSCKEGGRTKDRQLFLNLYKSIVFHLSIEDVIFKLILKLFLILKSSLKITYYSVTYLYKKKQIVPWFFLKKNDVFYSFFTIIDWFKVSYF